MPDNLVLTDDTAGILTLGGDLTVRRFGFGAMRITGRGILAELRQQGKIRHVGLSNVDVDQLREGQGIAPIVSVQNRYNLSDRRSENVLEACEADGLGFLPWFPLATGELAKGGGPLAEVAKAHRATPAQVALAWLLRRS